MHCGCDRTHQQLAFACPQAWHQCVLCPCNHAGAASLTLHDAFRTYKIPAQDVSSAQASDIVQAATQDLQAILQQHPEAGLQSVHVQEAQKLLQRLQTQAARTEKNADFFSVMTL